MADPEQRLFSALRSSESRLAAILASALDAVITIDEHGHVVDMNPAAERIFGYSSAEATGRAITALIAPDGAPGREQFGRELVSGGAACLGRRTEMNAIRADGSVFAAEVSLTRIETATAPLFTGFVRDLTRRNGERAERQALLERLHRKERMASLGQLAGSVAHDFNNVLMIMLGSAELIVDADDVGGAHARRAAAIIDAGERGKRLTERLTTFAHREPVLLEVLDLNRIVTEIRPMLEQALPVGVELVVDLRDGVPSFEGDRGQTDQLILNAVINARDAMTEGGSLHVATSRVEVDRRTASRHPLIEAGTFVRLMVTDTGVGMSPDVAARAFEPFFTTKAKGDGSGLGLATVQSIVAAAGGALDLDSEVGRGTTLTVYLPGAAESSEDVVTPPHLELTVR